MTKEQKSKIQNSLVFHTSDLWDAVMVIIDECERAECSIAISQGFDETKRAHQCGRAEGILYVKELLNDTRNAALDSVNRKSVDN
jgi:hypothetical protein